MSEFQKKDECCILDSGISNIIVLHEEHPPVLQFFFLSVSPTDKSHTKRRGDCDCSV